MSIDAAVEKSAMIAQKVGQAWISRASSIGSSNHGLIR
jgi:hypothetical protein